ncbi:MAG: sigma-70 family RNA polymerase sigma factor [Bacteroidales bacterium]|nr:sigma-70 family RNA polymerase sigma factor [Bacteroidales bacterium]MDD3988694.1 sigma-70 family RNA polymerase sigma factor [Bacteroidales bacterium]MDD4639243.1 sigma-70 family RNA polymerase sigma factor [Bacteroidales bacterium]
MKKFETFVKEHYASICAVAERLVKSESVAKDIAQDVIIKFWEKSTKENISSVDDYLFVMVRNASLNYLRGRKREEKRYLSLLLETENEQELFNLLVEEEYNQLLISAINQLPKPNARVIRYALSGYNNKEIALLLGISINTIKSMKYSSIRRLREYFSNYG